MRLEARADQSRAREFIVYEQKIATCASFGYRPIENKDPPPLTGGSLFTRVFPDSEFGGGSLFTPENLPEFDRGVLIHRILTAKTKAFSP